MLGDAGADWKSWRRLEDSAAAVEDEELIGRPSLNGVEGDGGGEAGATGEAGDREADIDCVIDRDRRQEDEEPIDRRGAGLEASLSCLCGNGSSS
jgi:hypothetical protein